ncbi:MAG: hypothetical protein QOG53_1846 [Frankiales bacterium]|jgi:hypothetical protein|nr:hypothetical protein [Frankiales bacterium]
MHRSILGCAVVVALVGAGPAGAHGGSGAAYTGIAGRYKVVGYDGRAGLTANDVEYRILLTDADTQAPVDGATVLVTATLAVGDRRIEPEQQAAATANIYSFTLPRLAGATWRIDANISGSAGSASAQYFVHAASGAVAVDASSKTGGGKGKSWVLNAALIGVLVVAVIAAALIRRGSARPKATK